MVVIGQYRITGAGIIPTTAAMGTDHITTTGTVLTIIVRGHHIVWDTAMDTMTVDTDTGTTVLTIVHTAMTAITTPVEIITTDDEDRQPHLQDGGMLNRM